MVKARHPRAVEQPGRTSNGSADHNGKIRIFLSLIIFPAAQPRRMPANREHRHAFHAMHGGVRAERVACACDESLETLINIHEALHSRLKSLYSYHSE